MPPKRARKPIQVSTAPEPTQSHHVRRTGTRQEVRLTPHAAEDVPANPPVRLADTEDLQQREFLQLLDRELEQDAQEHIIPSSGVGDDGLEDDELRAELEAQIDDTAEMFTPLKSSGQGQNAMLHDWMNRYSNSFLREFYRQYAGPEGSPCLCDKPEGHRFRCSDCLTAHRYCATCLKSTHEYLPHHRISRWDGKTWTRTSIAEQKIPLKLSMHGLPCLRSPPTPFLLGDVNGFHDITVTYCICPRPPEQYKQLLRSGIMPCSTDTPKSGFTFRALRLFDLLAADAKLSCSRYHAVLQRQSNNIEPDKHSPRLRELLRVTRQWTAIQQRKRSGQISTDIDTRGALALRCPACPRLGVNYLPDDVSAENRYLFAQQLSYDGSFQLVRKNKAHDEFDMCLSDGLLYWVKQRAYLAHLTNNTETNYAQTTHVDGTCNNHRAANDTWVKQSGVAETGVGAVTCARHTLFMPQGCVNYWKGERFAYTDYAIASVMADLIAEDADQIGVFYNIFCHWSKNFWARAPTIRIPHGELQRPARFFGGVPKYHLAGHIDSCYAQYSLNNMHGAGRLDAEGCERAWANLNGASGSTSEKGPGSRIDALNNCMNDWNWRKLVTMISFLVKKLKEAVQMGEEQEQAWLIFHDTVDTSLTSRWATMSTDPVLVNRKWTSVFLLDQSKSTSRLKTVLDLNSSESARIIDSESTEPGFTAPSWVSEGIDLENIQCKLRGDVAELSDSMTDRKALDIYNRRVSLTNRIATHRRNAALFIDIRPDNFGSMPSLAQETDGQPEHASLYLPSRLGKRLMPTERSQRVSQLEETLRRAECLESLQRARTACLQKSQMLIGKGKNARGEVANTRAQGMIGRLSKRITNITAEYNMSYDALKTLGATSEQLSPLQPLHDTQFSGLMTILRRERGLGEKNRKLPWFWAVRGTGEQGEPIIRSEEDIDAIRVEWFRGRERFCRWREEELWIRREIASTLFSYQDLQIKWKNRSLSEYAESRPGYRAYCVRQSDVFLGLLSSGFQRTKEILAERPDMKICMRARSELGTFLKANHAT